MVIVIDRREQKMGPQLLLDKSALQALSDDEISFMSIHYYNVIAPVIIAEILGDLKKYPEDAERSIKNVCGLADKVPSLGSLINEDCRTLLAWDLLGYYEVIMDGTPIRSDGIPVRMKSGKKGVYFKESQEKAVLRRWIDGEFTEVEANLADVWRKYTKSIDLEGWKRSHTDYPRVKDWETLNSYVSQLSDTPFIQMENITFLINEMSLNDKVRKEVFDRWILKGMPLLKHFSPYGHYCLRVLHAFYLATVNNIDDLGTRSTNRIDLEYIFYLPFCKIFSSGDKFHVKFTKIFLRENQEFIHKDDLKADLKKIKNYWDSLTEQERKEYRKNNGYYPPNFPESFTNRVWKKYMKPRENYKNLTQEEQEDFIKSLEPMIKEIAEIRKRVQ